MTASPWPDYESRFDNWETRSSVRTRPRRLFDLEGEPVLLFPPESVPALAHPLVAAAGPGVADLVLQHSLYQYLHFTTVLEQLAVLPVTAQLSLGVAGLDLPAAMRRDAFKITTDEAWHAQFSDDLTAQMVAATGVTAESVIEPAFVSEIRRLRAGFDPADRPLVDLVFAVVSETLVSALLADVPNDRRLARPVREVVADHAADEGRHHSYFQSLLRILWPTLSVEHRRLLGPQVPAFVRAFLHPDLAAVRSALVASGLSVQTAAEIVHQSYDPGAAVFDIRRQARATVRGFRGVGALDDPRTKDAFLRAGLLSDNET
jgi:hypothetical protein